MEKEREISIPVVFSDPPGSAAEILLRVLERQSSLKIQELCCDFLFCVASDLILFIKNDIITRVSNSCSRLGYTRDELVGKSWKEFVYYEDLEKSEEKSRAVMSELLLLNFFNRWKNKKNLPVRLEWSAIVSGETLICVVRILDDQS